MAGDTGCRIDLAVDFMLAQIISPVRQGPFRGVLKFVAWFEFFLVRVAVGTKGFCMAGVAGLLLLRRIEFMFFDPILPVVQRCPPINMTFAAQGHALDLNGVLPGSALMNGTGKQQYAG